jgi:hypothetical protein
MPLSLSSFQLLFTNQCFGVILPQLGMQEKKIKLQALGAGNGVHQNTILR